MFRRRCDAVAHWDKNINLTLKRSGAAGPRKSLGAHLRLNVLTDAAEAANVAGQERERDCVE